MNGMNIIPYSGGLGGLGGGYDCRLFKLPCSVLSRTPAEVLSFRVPSCRPSVTNFRRLTDFPYFDDLPQQHREGASRPTHLRKETKGTLGIVCSGDNVESGKRASPSRKIASWLACWMAVAAAADQGESVHYPFPATTAAC